MLYLHFEYLERTGDGCLLTDEHNLMLEEIRAKDVELADERPMPIRGSSRINFIGFLRENYTTDVSQVPKLQRSDHASAEKIGFIGTGAMVARPARRARGSAARHGLPAQRGCFDAGR